MPGRKQTTARKWFSSVPSSGKTKKVRCDFCHWTVADNGTRIVFHLKQCPKCPSHVKAKYRSESLPANEPASISRPSTVALASGSATTMATANVVIEEKRESDTVVSVTSHGKDVKEDCVPVYDVSASASYCNMPQSC